MDLVVIYEGENACTQCLGWKRVDNGDDKGSWKYWAELPEQSAIAEGMGFVKPIECPRCNGTGIEPSPHKREALAAYAHDAWSSYMAYFLRQLDQDDEGNLIISKAYVRNLYALIATGYNELSEDDKQGDREEADKILAIVEAN